MPTVGSAAPRHAGPDPCPRRRCAVARRLCPQVSNVNPLYAQLRDAAWAAMQSNGGQLDPRVLASLERARDMPLAEALRDGRYGAAPACT